MKLILFVVAFILVSSQAHCEQFIGHCRDREPDLIADGDTCTGPVATIIERALSNMGSSVIWVETPWKRSIESAKAGMVDILPRHSMKPEREAFLHAVTYGYKVRRIYFMISPLKDIAINNFSDLVGLKVGMLRGSFYSEQLDRATDLNKVELDTNDQIVKMLEYGRIDVGVTSSAHEEEKFRALPNIKEAFYKDAFLNSRNISIPKASPKSQYFQDFAAQIEAMAASGEVARIFADFNIEAPVQKDWQ